ncbi:MAG: protein glxC, partial [Gammaproteobacteria bacterium]|nr:protein glxC [Gammaproteobacteria bacterium]
GDALGDSLYEARIYVRGKVASLGADCIEKPMQTTHKTELKELLDQANLSNINADEFRRYGSARKLYNFNIDNVGAY